MKLCKKCGITKEKTLFAKSNRYKDGLQTKCKECNRLYRLGKEEKIKKYNKKYSEKNKEQLSNSKKEYYLKNENAIKAARKNRYYTNVKNGLAINKKWAEANPEKVKKAQINYHHSFIGIITIRYAAQKVKSKQRGHKPPEYTKEQLITWCIESEDFNIIYTMWKEKGYPKWFSPSLDRHDNNIGYSFKNIQAVPWYFNDMKERITKRLKHFNLTDQ